MESTADQSHWYAIKTRSEASTQAYLEGVCRAVYIPKLRIRTTDNNAHTALRSVAPHLLFIKATEAEPYNSKRRATAKLEKLHHFGYTDIPALTKFSQFLQRSSTYSIFSQQMTPPSNVKSIAKQTSTSDSTCA